MEAALPAPELRGLMARRLGEGLIEGLLGSEGAQTICSGVRLLLPAPTASTFSLPTAESSASSARRWRCSSSVEMGERRSDRSSGVDSLWQEKREGLGLAPLCCFSTYRIPLASLRFGSGGLLLDSASGTLLLAAGRSGSSAGGRLGMGLGVCEPVGVALPASALIFKAVASGFSAPLSRVKQVASGLTMPEVELVLQRRKEG